MTNTIRLILRHHGPVDQRETNLAAVEGGHADFGHILLDHSAEVDIQGERTLVVVNYDSIGIVHDIYNSPPENEILLSAAAERGPVKIIQLLIYHPPDVNAAPPDQSGDAGPGILASKQAFGRVRDWDFDDMVFDTSALSCAATGGHPEILKLLLAHGADVNGSSQYGHPPLICAASGNRQAHSFSRRGHQLQN